MEFVDEHKVKLDDTIDHWMPELPEANKVTLKMLANQTSGYPDLRNRSEMARRFHRRSVPHLDFRRANEVRVRPSRCNSLRERTGVTRTPTS